ncbi:MAG: DNA polymerase III subunit gamma/tau [Planctomycetota bacterium]|nr:MAG: DNA polymerase III subunit gamma/tau [Planctomycetota bacterium]
MTYLVIARKYRPQTFEEVVGQSHIVETLRNSILSGRVGHAYLFSGSRGVGKTSLARIFAKSLNCPEVKDANPCNRCETCESISAGTNIDVIEIDGASHRSVEDIEVLRDGSQYMPTRSPYKIYIIDEVHMLTRHAFNALLKTLEEPPPHVKFIFATTEPNKVPDTILSRCQRFDFRRITPQDIVERLRQIAEKEGVDIETSALYQIAQASNGGMRDAQSLLDQAISFCGAKLTSEEISRILGTLPQVKVLDFIRFLNEGRKEEGLALIDEIYWMGGDLSLFLEQVVENMRNLMVFLSLGERGRDFSGAPLREEVWRPLAKTTTLPKAIAFTQALIAAKKKVRQDSQARVILEMTFLYLCHFDEFLRPSNLLRKVEDFSSKSSFSLTSPLTPKPTSSSTKGKLPVSASTPSASSAPSAIWKVEEIKNNWTNFLEILHKKLDKSFSLCLTYLEEAKCEKITSDSITICFFQDFLKEVVEENQEFKRALENLLFQLTQKKITVYFTYSSLSSTQGTLGGRGCKSGDSAEYSHLPEIVQKAIEMFQGTLLRPRETSSETNK